MGRIVSTECSLLNGKLLLNHLKTSDKGVVGWCDGVGKLPVLGRPTYLERSMARAYCACSRCGWGLFGYFFSRLSFLFFSLGDGPI